MDKKKKRIIKFSKVAPQPTPPEMSGLYSSSVVSFTPDDGSYRRGHKDGYREGFDDGYAQGYENARKRYEDGGD